MISVEVASVSSRSHPDAGGDAPRVGFLKFTLDSDPRALGSLSAARPTFDAPVALFGAWLSFRHHG
jgi:hypothetical protein